MLSVIGQDHGTWAVLEIKGELGKRELQSTVMELPELTGKDAQGGWVSHGHAILYTCIPYRLTSGVSKLD
jgi:hypothetical protein